MSFLQGYTDLSLALAEYKANRYSFSPSCLPTSAKEGFDFIKDFLREEGFELWLTMSRINKPLLVVVVQQI